MNNIILINVDKFEDNIANNFVEKMRVLFVESTFFYNHPQLFSVFQTFFHNFSMIFSTYFLILFSLLFLSFTRFTHSLLLLLLNN